MSKLLALSFDGPSSPGITLKGPASPEARAVHPYGWGFAWYPPEERGAVAVKDPTSQGDDAMTSLLRDWSRFRAATFICHLRGAARRSREEDTHPFVRSYAARDWVLTHNGHLAPGWAERLALGGSPSWEPVGRTDTEHVLCWLLERMRGQGHRSLADCGWERLHGWFREVDALGTANLVLSDGLDLIAYQDDEGFNPLHWCRRRPPHHDPLLGNAEVGLDLSDARDHSRVCLLVATDPLSGDGWTRLEPGQMLVIRGGAVFWDSRGEATRIAKRETSEMPAPAPTTPAPAALRPAPADPAVVAPSELPEAMVSMQSAGSSVAVPGPPSPGPDASGHRTYQVTHETVYRYDAPVERSLHLIRLRPVVDRLQEVVSHELTVAPEGIRQRYDDVFGNEVLRVELDGPFQEIRLASRSVVRVHAERSRQLDSPTRRDTIPLVWMPWQRQMMTPYLLPPELPEAQLSDLFDYAMSFVSRQDYNLTETLMDMNRTIHRDYAYLPGSTTNETTPFEVYTSRRGVCQDFANLLICLARLIGLPARYRVGYIHTGGKYENEMQSDASHAWAELYLPWFGWQGFDPTNGCLAGLDHVRVACGRHYRDATPTSGTIFRGGGNEQLTISVRVEPADG